MGNLLEMKRFRRYLVVATILACLWPVGVPAQQMAKDEGEVLGNSEFVGKIQTAEGKAIEGAQVLLYHLSTEALFTSEPTSRGG